MGTGDKTIMFVPMRWHPEPAVHAGMGSKLGFFNVRCFGEKLLIQNIVSVFISWKLIFLQFQSNVSEFLVWFTYINFPLYIKFLVILQGYSK